MYQDVVFTACCFKNEDMQGLGNEHKGIQIGIHKSR